MTEMLRTRAGHAFRRMAVPLVAYYTVTLALPLANGATQAGAAFVKHAIVVLVVPAVAIVAGCAVFTLARALIIHARRTPRGRQTLRAGSHFATSGAPSGPPSGRCSDRIINPQLRDVDSRSARSTDVHLHAQAFEPLPAGNPFGDLMNPPKKLRRLVDELNLLVCPVMLGSGKGLSVGGVRRRARGVDSRSTPSRVGAPIRQRST